MLIMILCINFNVLTLSASASGTSCGSSICPVATNLSKHSIIAYISSSYVTKSLLTISSSWVILTVASSLTS